MKRRVIMIILILLTFVLQTTLMQTFAIASVSPNLPIILTVSFALMRGKREGMFVGAFFGILMDIFTDRCWDFICSSSPMLDTSTVSVIAFL